MKSRFVLSQEAALDLAEIWRYIKDQTSVEVADRVERVIRDRIVLLSANPGVGHARADLTDSKVKFLSVYSYLIVYRPENQPLQVVSILHGHRNVGQLLKHRL